MMSKLKTLLPAINIISLTHLAMSAECILKHIYLLSWLFCLTALLSVLFIYFFSDCLAHKVSLSDVELPFLVYTCLDAL